MYAIETFGSTGKGHVENDVDCSHYMRNFDTVNTKTHIRYSQITNIICVKPYRAHDMLTFLDKDDFLSLSYLRIVHLVNGKS